MNLIERRLAAVAKEIVENPEIYPDDDVEKLMEKLETAVGIDTPHAMNCPNCQSNQWFAYPKVLECVSCGYGKEMIDA